MSDFGRYRSNGDMRGSELLPPQIALTGSPLKKRDFVLRITSSVAVSVHIGRAGLSRRPGDGHEDDPQYPPHLEGNQ